MYLLSLMPAYIATDKALFFSSVCADIFLIFQSKHMLWYSLEAPRWGASNEYPQHMFSLINKKNIMWIPPLICSYVHKRFCSNASNLNLFVFNPFVKYIFFSEKIRLDIACEMSARVVYFQVSYFTTLLANSADDKWTIFFLTFPRK